MRHVLKLVRAATFLELDPLLPLPPGPHALGQEMTPGGVDQAPSTP